MKPINLLPKAGQDQLKTDALNELVRKFWIMVVTSLVILLVLGFGVQQYLRLQANRVDNDIMVSRQRLESSELKEVQDQVLDLNANLTEVSNIRNQQYKWSEVLVELSRILPHDAQLNSVNIERATGQVVILGRAADRDGVIDVWSQLKKSELFYDVNFPLPNLERPTDSNFTYTFFVNLEMIKHD